MTTPIRATLLHDDPTAAGRLAPAMEAVGFNVRLVPHEPDLIRRPNEFEHTEVMVLHLEKTPGEYLQYIRSLKPQLPRLPFLIVSDMMTETAFVPLMRLGYVGEFKTSQMERLYEVSQRTLSWLKDTGREVQFAPTDYEAIFQQSPDPIYLEDFSMVRTRVDELRAKGITDFGAFFRQNPGVVMELINSIVLLDSNQPGLDYIKATSLHDIFQLGRTVHNNSVLVEYAEELTRLANGETEFAIHGQNVRGGHHILSFKALRGHEQDLRRAMVMMKDVSDLMESQRQAKQQESLLRALVEQTPSIFYTESIAEKGRLLYISPQIEDLIGYSKAEMEADPDIWYRIVHPDDVGMVMSFLEEHTTPNQTNGYDYRFITRDGRVIWVRDTFRLIADANGKGMFWQGALSDVTNEKLAQIELTQSNEMLDHLMSSLPGTVYRTRIKEPARIEFMSQGCYGLTGYTAEELMQLTRAEVRSLLQVTDELDDKPHLLLPQEDGKYFEVVYTLRTRTGDLKWVLDRGYAHLDNAGEVETFEGIMLDITERKQAEEKVLEYSEEVEQLYRNSTMVSAIMDAQTLGENVINIIGDRRNYDAIGINLYVEGTGQLEVSSHKQHPGLEGYWEGVQRMKDQKISGATQRVYETRQTLRSGNVEEVEGFYNVLPGVIKSCLYVPIIAGDECLGVFVIESMEPDAFTENDEKLLGILASQVAVTMVNTRLLHTAQNEIAARQLVEQELLVERQMLEDKVAERTSELQDANLELEKLSRMKTEFMAAISHELRTPLTGILGLSEVLGIETFGPVNERQQNALRLILENGQRLLAVINNILDFTRIDSGKTTLSIGSLSLNYMVHNMVRPEQVVAEAKGVHLIYEPPATDVMIDGDNKKLKQIVSNLLTNAVKFTPIGGTVRVSIEDLPSGYAQLSISDTGIGISEADQEKLFKPFVQLDGRLERTYNGIGLGLVLVHRLVGLHGGTIEVNSEVGKGSTFIVTLPKKHSEG